MYIFLTLQFKLLLQVCFWDEWLIIIIFTLILSCNIFFSVTFILNSSFVKNIILSCQYWSSEFDINVYNPVCLSRFWLNKINSFYDGLIFLCDMAFIIFFGIHFILWTECFNYDMLWRVSFLILSTQYFVMFFYLCGHLLP